jgi:phosphohistidine phosphatase
MGKKLYEQGEKPDLIITSPAKRAFSTARRIAKELDYSVKNIVKDETLYMADTDDFFKVIHSVPDSVKRLMLYAHNYGITYFANHISESQIDNIPTCGVVRIDFDVKSWKEIENKKGKMVFFEYPKKHKT